MQSKNSITSYIQFKIIAWTLMSTNAVYFLVAQTISINNSEKNIPEFIKNKTELTFWIIFLSTLILTLMLRKIIEKLMNKNPPINPEQYYGKEIVKLIFLENVSIIGIVFIILLGFNWLYSLFFLTPIALMLKFFPSEYQEKQ